MGPAWPYRGGGLAAFNERLAHEYIKEGHDVEIVTFTLQYPSFLFPGKTQYSSEPAPEGLNIKRLLSSVNPFSWLKTGRYIKRQRPDLLICAFWLPFMAPSLGTTLRIAKRPSTKRISIVHNLIPHEHRPGDKIFARWFVNSCDGFVTLSRSVLDDLDRFDPRKKLPRTFSPHPIYDHYGESIPKTQACNLLNIAPECRYALFFGFIRDYKGLDLLISAMADKRLADLNVKLIVAGEFYGDPKPYMEQIERLNIADRIILKSEFIPNSEVSRYFCAADVVVQPYKSATQSGVTQIAFHFEKPMIVTNVGGLPEIVPNEKVGFVVEPNAKTIADAILRYYDESWQPRLTEGVKTEKQKYLWCNMTKAISEVAKIK